MINQFKHKLNYRVSGDGYPVVFLHGFLESSSMWERLNLNDNFLCVEIDFPGHGDSECKENQNYKMSSLAVEIKNLLSGLKIDAYSIVGHSMGGYVGLELMKIDKRCSKLILLNSNFWKDSTKKIEDRVRVASVVKRNKNFFLYESIPNLFYDPERFNSEVKSLIEEARKIDSNVIAEYSLAMSQREDNSEFVDLNAANILVVQGEFDNIIPFELMRGKLVNLACKSIVLNGCGHMSQIESPGEVVQSIKLFLN